MAASRRPRDEQRKAERLAKYESERTQRVEAERIKREPTNEPFEPRARDQEFLTAVTEFLVNEIRDGAQKTRAHISPGNSQACASTIHRRNGKPMREEVRKDRDQELITTIDQ